jgi:hypothetical protein
MTALVGAARDTDHTAAFDLGDLAYERANSSCCAGDEDGVPGLWRADLETINFLNATTDEQVVIIDTFDNPVKVERALLMEKLLATYKQVMTDWHNEWSELEKKR